MGPDAIHDSIVPVDDLTKRVVTDLRDDAPEKGFASRRSTAATTRSTRRSAERAESRAT
jgi:hypothetical protein